MGRNSKKSATKVINTLFVNISLFRVVTSQLAGLHNNTDVLSMLRLIELASLVQLQRSQAVSQLSMFLHRAHSGWMAVRVKLASLGAILLSTLCFKNLQRLPP